MIAIVDCGIGNVGSVANMFRKIGVPAVASGDPEVVADGEARASGRRCLRPRHDRPVRGLIPILERRVLHDRTPILGICLGLQLLTRNSEEGACPGLAWLRASTVRFRFSEEEQARLKVPHMGWNTVHPARAGGWPSL
jgi:glutamine amidotransferase